MTLDLRGVANSVGILSNRCGNSIPPNMVSSTGSVVNDIILRGGSLWDHCGVE